MRWEQKRWGKERTARKKREENNKNIGIVYDTLRHRKRIKNMMIIEFIEKMAIRKKKRKTY